MTYSRYNSKSKIKNDNELYNEHFQKRDLQYIKHYTTPKISHIDPSNFSKLQTHSYIWKTGDKLYKLAYEFYGDSSLWWVIAWFNKRPTESHYVIGQTVLIPKPVEEVLKIMGV